MFLALFITSLLHNVAITASFCLLYSIVCSNSQIIFMALLVNIINIIMEKRKCSMYYIISNYNKYHRVEEKMYPSYIIST